MCDVCRGEANKEGLGRQISAQTEKKDKNLVFYSRQSTDICLAPTGNGSASRCITSGETSILVGLLGW